MVTIFYHPSEALLFECDMKGGNPAIKLKKLNFFIQNLKSFIVDDHSPCWNIFAFHLVTHSLTHSTNMWVTYSSQNCCVMYYSCMLLFHWEQKMVLQENGTIDLIPRASSPSWF